MPTLAARINAFINPTVNAPAGDTVATTSTAPVITEDIYSRFKVEADRKTVIKDCRAMYDGDPRVEKMHRRLAQDLMRGGFFVKTKNADALLIAGLLQTRLKLNQKMEDWLRLTSRDGDSFLELEISDGSTTMRRSGQSSMLISGVTRKPTLTMHRNSNSADRFDSPERAFWMGSDNFFGAEIPQDAIYFPEWKIIHARWNHDEENRYGRPMMKSARKTFKYVEDGELNVAVRRKIGGAQLRQHVIEGSAADVEKYKEDNKLALGKLAAVIDFFSNKASSLTVHQGDGNIDKIGDVEHHIATMGTASDTPMELIAYGGELNRDILGDKKDAYEDTLNQGREWAATEILHPLLQREWMLNGLYPADIEYKIIWRKARTLSPTDLRDLADAASRLRVVGVKEDVVQVILASYLQDVDLDILQGDGLDSAAFANNLKGISI
jgi:hypothetical protein